MCLWAKRKPGPPSQKCFPQRDIGGGRSREERELQRVNREAHISKSAGYVVIKKLPCPFPCPRHFHTPWHNFRASFKSSTDIDPQG